MIHGVQTKLSSHMSQVGPLSLIGSTEGRSRNRMEEAMEDLMTTEITTLRDRATAAARAIGVQIGSIKEIETEVTKVALVEAIETKAPGSMGREEITVVCEKITRGLLPGMGMEITKIRTTDSLKEEAIETGALTSPIDNKIRDISMKIKIMTDQDYTRLTDDTRGLNQIQGRENIPLVLLGLALSPLKDEEGLLQTTKTRKSKNRPISRISLV